MRWVLHRGHVSAFLQGDEIGGLKHVRVYEYTLNMARPSSFQSAETL